MLARARLTGFAVAALLATVGPASAAAPGTGNLVVSRPAGTPPSLAEFTPEGALIQSWPIVAGSGSVRGAAFDAAGRLHVQVGTSAPALFTWDPVTAAWTRRTFAGWSVSECASCGGVAAGEAHVFAVDMATSGTGAANGLIRFPAEGDAVVRFATGVDYSDVALGADGLLYARRANPAATVVDVFDPAGPTFLRAVSFAHPCVAFEADAAGNLFGVFGASIVRYAPTGAVLGGRTLTISGSFVDLARAADGRLVATTTGGQTVILDALGAPIRTFASGVSGHVAVVPELRPPLVCADSTGPGEAALAAARGADEQGPMIALSWTAPADTTWEPGDDVCVAVPIAAASYDVRWSTAPIVTDADFAAAHAADGEPVPAAPGAAESFVLRGAPDDVTVHVALRSADAEGRASPMAIASVAPPPPPPHERPCPRGWAHWKDASGWPATLVLGEHTYTETEARAFLGGVEGDASLALARQLVAAKLNLGAGTQPEPAADAVAAADAAIGARRLPAGVGMNSADGLAMREIARELESYNQGERTPECSSAAALASKAKAGRLGKGGQRRAAIARVAPNPIVAAALVTIEVREATSVHVAVFDLQGRVRRVLASGDLAAGSHVVSWDGAGADGVALPRGVYLIRASTPSETSVRKVIVSATP